jgi:uncharacterized HAD superfamily protein
LRSGIAHTKYPTPKIMSVDLSKKRVGLDVDGVLCNFPKGVINLAAKEGKSHLFPATEYDVSSWMISEQFSELMQLHWDNPDFWLGLEPLRYSLPLDFEPAVYITARRIDGWVTHRWLTHHGFPKATVITVKRPEDKLQHIRDLELDLFVDDHYGTVDELRLEGLNGVLMAAPYQRGHDIPEGMPIIHSLAELRYRPELFKEDK